MNEVIISDSNVVIDMPIIVNSHIKHILSETKYTSKIANIHSALKLMLNGRYEKYSFNEEEFNKAMDKTLSESEFQKILSILNEKQTVRKANGVFYTPKDVIAFIVSNCINQIISGENKIISEYLPLSAKENAEMIACKKTVLDPTCGAGEFLIYSFQKKMQILIDNHIEINDVRIMEVLKTINGNDINIESIEITKTRLFFETIKYIKNTEKYVEISKIINKNMLVEDFVDLDAKKFPKYDIIIGNPPYVEDSKAIIRPKNKYGNIYANVLQNSIDILKPDGVIGFIIPISYISTPRMNKIRRYVENSTSKQFVLNYADRPDCLFTSVHQKLSILIAKKGVNHKLYTAGYKYWYKSERQELFKNLQICENAYIKNNFYPKIDNKTELSIFEKVYTEGNDNIIDSCFTKTANNIFLNMRACFWIKAFSFNPGSKEYKGFSYSEQTKDYMLCLLNSSLYFLFWILVSDCWHITTKELKHFKVKLKNVDFEKFSLLARELENELEKTKEYVGSKQTEFEYKHKRCKHIIDKINDELGAVYGLTQNETEHIKTFASKYRESLGG